MEKKFQMTLFQVFNQEKEMVMNTGLKSCKLSGKIVETCSKKGCWMTLDTGEDTLFIKFRDYGFFVPIDSVEEKNAVVQGDLFWILHLWKC